MKLDKIKAEMIKWRDFYGGDIPDTEAIKGATDREQLNAIMEQHRRLLEDMLADANRHLDNFKSELGLPF